MTEKSKNVWQSFDEWYSNGMKLNELGGNFTYDELEQAFNAGGKAELIEELIDRLNFGRNYLMSVEPDKLTVADALEAFGFGRNGLKS